MTFKLSTTTKKKRNCRHCVIQ